jgi:restriction system protein
MTPPPSDPETIETKLREAMVSLTTKQFDQLVLFLIRDLTNPKSVEFVPADSDSAIDLEVTVDHPFATLQYGVSLVRPEREADVGPETVEAVAASISDRGLGTATLISTGAFTLDAVDRADEAGISLVSGPEIASLFFEHELGFVKTKDGFELDTDFWELFRGQTRSDRIPSIEIPQADSLDRLEQTLRVVAAGNHHKDAIAAAVEDMSGDSFDPRQADYYGTAGWLLGFLHKDLEGMGERGRGRWGLTRLGRTYLDHLDAGDDETARRLLFTQIREIEIVRRTLTKLADAGTLRRGDIVDIVEQETDLGGTTVPRRARTLVNWLEELPEITTTGTGDSQQIKYHDERDTTPPKEAVEPDHESSIPRREGNELADDSADPPDEDSILDDIIASFETPPTEE